MSITKLIFSLIRRPPKVNFCVINKISNKITMLFWTAKAILVFTFTFWSISESKSVSEEVKDALPLEDPNFCQHHLNTCIQV